MLWHYVVCAGVAEHVQAVTNKEKAEEKAQANQIRVALEQQMDQLRDVHTLQVAKLRDEISEKQELINELKEWVPSRRLSQKHVGS